MLYKSCSIKIQAINDCLLSKCKIANAYSIVELSEKNKYPIAYIANGEYKRVDFDGGLVYHRINGKVKIIREGCHTRYEAPIRMVISVDKTKLCNNDMSAFNLLELGVLCLGTNTIKESEIDSKKVHEEEIKGCEVPFKTASIYIDYILKW